VVTGGAPSAPRRIVVAAGRKVVDGQRRCALHWGPWLEAELLGRWFRHVAFLATGHATALGRYVRTPGLGPSAGRHVVSPAVCSHVGGTCTEYML
jgi:hypothetical protein